MFVLFCNIRQQIFRDQIFAFLIMSIKHVQTLCKTSINATNRWEACHQTTLFLLIWCFNNNFLLYQNKQ